MGTCVEDIARRGRALRGFIGSRLPAEFDVTGDRDAWPLVGTALLSRATTTLDSILHLHPRGQATDAGTLLRSLYEHVVHLAWLASDPSAERLEEWRKDDLTSRLVADAECRERGVELFTDEDRAKLQAQVESMRGRKLVLVNLAVAADKHWAGQLPAMKSHQELTSFRGLYAILYRQYSGTAHPGYRGLNVVLQDITATCKRVVLEGPSKGHGPYGMATVIYALGLYVASQSLGWPAAQDVDAVFEQDQ